MADYNSKYTGEQVEQLLDQVASGNAGGGGGGITVETDPIFSASPAATITEEKKAEWDNKVDKVDGKQLSTEDFTTLLKQKLDGLSNYDDTAISQAVDKLRSDLDALVSGDTTTAIKTFNEVIAFLDGIQDTQDLSGIIASIEQQIAGKMDKVTLAAVATSGSYNDLADKPTIPDVSNKQDTLVSGTNIKTINGNSLLGSGDIVISGGGGGGYDDTEIKGQISEIEATIGDINTILESIINGGIITFTIEGVEFRGETGMTWKEWLLTDYNTHNFTESADGHVDIQRDIITYGLADLYFLGYSDGTKVSLNDKVINGYSYIIIT